MGLAKSGRTVLNQSFVHLACRQFSAANACLRQVQNRWVSCEKTKKMNDSKYDERLWFLHKGCDGKHYFISNPHTFPGRMLAWCPIRKTDFCVPKSEMEAISESAKYWIQGFLTGNQPNPPLDESGDVNFDSPEYKNWLIKIEEFGKTGDWE